MGIRDYPRLTVEQFGHHLIKSGDLDPIYIALHRLRGADKSRPGPRWPEIQVKRFMVAYWCFYDAGVASYLAEQYHSEDFWGSMRIAGKNETPTPWGGRWARGHERRHFRGENAMKALVDLNHRYRSAPEAMVDYIVGGAPSYTGVADRARIHVGFGPWITFKIADMLDRCLGVHVDFEDAAVFMFKDPVKGAELVWDAWRGLRPTPSREVQAITVKLLCRTFRQFTAPPLMDRPIGLQEVETVLCKWKSHLNGHYPVNNDIDEIRKGLQPWVRYSRAAEEFLLSMPEGVGR